MNISYQENANGTDLEKIWLVTTMNYDDNGRLLDIKKALKDYHGTQQQHGMEKTVVVNEYDELGQLKKKSLGPSNSNQYLESLDYKYNIRGWLSSINKDFFASVGVFKIY